MPSGIEHSVEPVRDKGFLIDGLPESAAGSGLAMRPSPFTFSERLPRRSPPRSLAAVLDNSPRAAHDGERSARKNNKSADGQQESPVFGGFQASLWHEDGRSDLLTERHPRSAGASRPSHQIDPGMLIGIPKEPHAI